MYTKGNSLNLCVSSRLSPEILKCKMFNIASLNIPSAFFRCIIITGIFFIFPPPHIYNSFNKKMSLVRCRHFKDKTSYENCSHFFIQLPNIVLIYRNLYTLFIHIYMCVCAYYTQFRSDVES